MNIEQALAEAKMEKENGPTWAGTPEPRPVWISSRHVVMLYDEIMRLREELEAARKGPWIVGAFQLRVESNRICIRNKAGEYMETSLAAFEKCVKDFFDGRF